MKPLERALALRKSAHLRSKEPMRVYRNRLRQPERILELVEKRVEQIATKYEARRLFLVSISAAFEAYWREFVRINIDKHKVPIGTISHLKRASFSLEDVQRIIGKKLTLGELIASSYSFQGADAVNFALSEILQIKLFSEFREAAFEIREIPRKKRSKKRPLATTTIRGRQILASCCPIIERCFAIRHETVHNTGRIYRVGDFEAQRIENAAWQFNVFLGMHLERRFNEIWGRR